MKRIFSFILFLNVIAFVTCKSQKTDMKNAEVSVETSVRNAQNMPPFFVNALGDTIRTIIKSEEEWKQELDEQSFYVLRQKGTERPFTSPLLNEKHQGLFACSACGLPLFRSEEKFESGTGWPSFWKPADEANIMKDTDYNLGYARTELMCAKCGGHLGHVFDDGPKPTGMRYCINGISLSFVKSEN